MSGTNHCRFEYSDKPEPDVVFEEVGDNQIVWEVDWPERGTPTPEEFDRVGDIEVKTVVVGTDLPDEVQEEVDTVHDAVVELKEAMMDCRDLSEEQRQELTMGNLDALPEVEKR